MTDLERELLNALKETRDAAAAMMRAVAVEEEATVSRIMDRIGPEYDGFGVRANAVIRNAEAHL